MKYNDYPLEECAQKAGEIFEQRKPNVAFYQKWTCLHCKSRQTMEQKNIFFKQGKCEECGKITDITRCNYMIHYGLGASLNGK